MEHVISKAFMLSGRDFPLLTGVKVHHPTPGEVLNINDGILCEELYWAYVSTILSDPYDYMVMLDDIGLDYEKSNAFEVFTHKWMNAQEQYIKNKDEFDKLGASPLSIYKEALGFFFGEGRNFQLIHHKTGMYMIDTNDDNWILNKDAFCTAMDFIIKINCIENEDHIKPSTPSHKRILIEDKRMEERKRLKKKQDSKEHVERIGDAIATVLAGGAGSINHENCFNVPIYQLLSVSQSIQAQMVVQAKLNGIFTGMLKSDKLSDKDLRWV